MVMYNKICGMEECEHPEEIEWGFSQPDGKLAATCGYCIKTVGEVTPGVSFGEHLLPDHAMLQDAPPPPPPPVVNEDPPVVQEDPPVVEEDPPVVQQG